ncbi:hypothetical protein HKL94_02550 [Candidatus Parcubacteria bacterium]|nr:hypothetical protein [Candidatus Parcubacteria bacterium]
MSTLIIFLVFCQALGASIGAFAAVWSELAYVKAMRDGKIDAAERAHLTVIGHGLRYGMMLLLLASLGLIVVAYVERATPQPALSPNYWILIVLALLVIGISSARARRRVSFGLASAALFTAWWFLVYLSFGWIALSFGAAIMSFIVATAIFYAVFYFTRLAIGAKQK